MILYPLFDQCKKFTLDPFWIDMFDKFSKGHFPKDMTFDPRTYTFTFYHTIGRKKSKIVKRSKDPVTIFRIVKEGLHHKGILSPSEIPEENHPIFQYEKWFQIKSKSIREELISKYVDKTYPQQKEKFYEIMSLLQTKNIVPSDINMMDGCISSINIRTNTSDKILPFPKYEYQPKKNLLTSAVLSFSKERSKKLTCTSI